MHSINILLNRCAHMLAIASFLLVLYACSKPASNTTATAVVSGQVSFPADPTATNPLLEVVLKDSSPGNDAAGLIAVQRIRNPGPSPLQYSLSYATKLIDPAHRYVVQARLIDPDRLLYASDARAVITFGNPQRQDLQLLPAAPHAEGSNQQSEVVINGALVLADGEAKYVAHLNNQHVTRIEEQRHDASGDVSAIYQFKGALLLNAEERSAAGKSRTAATFDDTGHVATVNAWRNDQPAQAATGTAERLRNHADLLRNHALAAAAAQQHRGSY